MSKVRQDWGVRATLALTALVFFEAIAILLLIKLDLTVEVALAILGVVQSPAMLALGFYFGQRTGQPPQGGSQ